MGVLNKLNKFVSKFLSSYLSTRVIFLLDMIVSMVASLVMLVVVDVFLYSGSFGWKVICFWMGMSFLFSFIFIWRLRTYQIIVRHMTLYEMALFALVSFSKVAATSILWGLVLNFSPLLYFMAIIDLFFTFGLFFIIRLIMLFVYNIIKSQRDNYLFRECGIRRFGENHKPRNFGFWVFFVCKLVLTILKALSTRLTVLKTLLRRLKQFKKLRIALLVVVAVTIK